MRINLKLSEAKKLEQKTWWITKEQLWKQSPHIPRWGNSEITYPRNLVA